MSYMPVNASLVGFINWIGDSEELSSEIKRTILTLAFDYMKENEMVGS